MLNLINFPQKQVARKFCAFIFSAPAIIPTTSKTGSGRAENTNTIRYPCRFTCLWSQLHSFRGMILPPYLPTQKPVNSPIDAPAAAQNATMIGLTIKEYSMAISRLEEGSRIEAFERKQATKTPRAVNTTCFFKKLLINQASKLNITTTAIASTLKLDATSALENWWGDRFFLLHRWLYLHSQDQYARQELLTYLPWAPG